jgi:archaellum component FlaF (FlaF/FlaG flagellin family)
VALAVLVVLFVLVVLGVHSCQVSARNSALQDYNANVAAVVQQSNATGRTFFSVLTTGGNVHSEQTSLNQARDSADSQLRHARGLSVPDQVKQAQTYLLLALTMRRDAIRNVAQNIQPALASATSKDAVSAISTEMARLYASDAVYKDYTVPQILGALKSAGIAVTGPNAVAPEAGQFLPDIRWMTPAFVAAQLHANYPSSSSTTSNKKPAAGSHGHQLLSVSVAGTTLTAGASSTLTASPPPSFTLNFTNTGQNQETNVVCQVTVSGTPVSGQTTVPQTTPGQQTSCNVPLTTAPPTGTYTVTARIERVPGELSVTRNSQSFQITFK